MKSVLNRIRIFAIFATILMLTVIAMPMVVANNNYNILTIDKSVNPPTLPYREIRETPLHLIEICPTVERLTPYPHLLIASTCENRQKIIFEAIEKHSIISEKEQETLKENIIDIWEKYPIIYKIVDENYLITEGIWPQLYKMCDSDDKKSNYIVTLYQFDMNKMNAQNIRLTDAENEVFGKVWEILSKRASNEANTHNNACDTGFGILWRSNVHRDMTSIAVDWMIAGDCSHWFVVRASNAADDPDHGWWIDQNQVGRFEDDCWIERAWFELLVLALGERKALRLWTHSYINFGLGWWMGGAPEEAHHFGLKARNYVNANSWNSAADNIGYASHFLTDVGQPMHTGEIFIQIEDNLIGSDPCIHRDDFYNFVAANWEVGDNFKNAIIQDNRGWWFTGANDPRNCPDFAVKWLAGYSNKYVDFLVFSIIFNPWWEDCPDVIDLTRDVLIITMRWNRGLVWYTFQDII